MEIGGRLKCLAGVWGLAPISEGGSAAVKRKPLRLVMGGVRPPISTQPRDGRYTSSFLALGGVQQSRRSRLEDVAGGADPPAYTKLGKPLQRQFPCCIDAFQIPQIERRILK